MRTRPRVTRWPAPAWLPRPPRRGFRPWALGGLAVAATSVIVLTFFLSVYPARGFTVPVGWDQSEYLWRTTLAQEVGVHRIDQGLPAIATVKAGRPAFPVIAATLSSLGAVSPFRLAYVLPAVMAAVVGLAAGGFVASALGRSTWELGAVALGVSLSPLMARLMAPEAYLDTMFAAAVFLAAALDIAASMEERLAVIPAILLVGIGAAVHWPFFGFFAVTIALTGLFLGPRSWREWRHREARLLDTPTGRLATTVVGGAAVGTGLLYGVLADTYPSPRLDESEFAKKLRRDVPKYRFAFTLPAAAVGLASLLGRARPGAGDRSPPRSRFVLAFLVAWCVVVLAGYLALAALDLSVPGHRFLSFALAIPILGILAAVWVGRLAARWVAARGVRGRLWVAAAAGVVVVAALLGLSAFVTYGQWSSTRTWTEPAFLQDATAALGYLEATGVPADRPVVYVVATADANRAALVGHMIRATLPAARIPHAFLYRGTPQAYVEGRPDVAGTSRDSLPGLGRQPDPPIAVAMSSPSGDSFAGWVGEHADLVITDRVAVVEGPPPPGDIPAPSPVRAPVGAVAWWRLGALSVAALVALALVGLGWAVVLIGRWARPAALLAVSPAVGVAALVAGGIVADRLGFRLVGMSGALTPPAVAAAGVAVALVARARRPSPERHGDGRTDRAP